MDNVNIKINTHSSIRIAEGGKVFYFDPFELKGKFNDADYIFITHDHYDHLDPKSIQNAMNNTTKFICPTLYLHNPRPLKSYLQMQA